MMGKTNKLWKRLEVLLTIVVLWFTTEPHHRSIGYLPHRLLVALYLLFALIIIFRYWKRILYFLLKDKILLLFLLFPLLSVIWSTNPDASFGFFSRVIVRSTVFALYLASCYSLKDLLRLVTITLILSLIINIPVAVALPFGVSEDGSWKGFLGHKNGFGRLMAWAMVHFAILSVYIPKGRGRTMIGFGLALIALFFSQAKSSLSIGLSTLTFLPLYKSFLQMYRIKTLLITVSLLLGIGATTWLSYNIEYIIVNVLGKSLTLNGRLPIWEYFLTRIAERPWLGFGFDAFWTNPEEIWNAQRNLHWYSGHAHSGFIDLTLQLGIVGLSLFVVSFFITSIRIIYLLNATKRIEYFLMFAFLIVMFSTQFSVGITVLKDTIFWTFYVTISALTAVEMSRIRTSNQSEPSQFSASVAKMPASQNA
jgi:exopolysaccharide production protein ExoQ